MPSPSRYVAVAFLFVAYFNCSAALAAQACGSNVLAEALAPATAPGDSVTVNCNLTLQPNHVITRRLILEGLASSGVTLDCNNAKLNGGQGTPNFRDDMIQVRSRMNPDGTWERPTDVVIRNCRIDGSARVMGMVSTADLILSSRTPDHTEKMRNIAPTRVRFENMTIVGVGRNPFYVGNGATHVQLLNSTIRGRSDAVAVYLDAESAFNTIKGNRIEAAVSHAVLAIDGSSHNKILDNRFSGLNNGGIYLYRNCGELKIARHATPSHNVIVNNVFFYNKYKGDNPSVFIGSRNGKTRKGNFGFCGDDHDAKFGSGISNLDFAAENVVMQNQIYKRATGEMIRSKNWLNNSPNYIGHNKTVTAEEPRLAGCFIPNGFQQTFIAHGGSIEGFEIQETAAALRCEHMRYACNDGETSATRISSCGVRKVPFDCMATGTNAGCRKPAACAPGQKIVGAVAGCNLEFGSVSATELAGVQANNVQVLRASDHAAEGICSVGSNQLVFGNSVRSGHRMITGISGQTRVLIACKEHDDNGGDCHIKGNLYCR